MLEVRGLEARYGRIPALQGIDLRVGAAELVALVGANGAGKSTLLRALSGVQPASGEIFFENENLTKATSERRVALGLLHVPEGRQVFGPLCVEDNLRLGAYRRGRAALARSLERVYALFPALAERRRHAAGTLSGGQQQMLAIGRALMGEPRLLLLDEPSMGLAPRLVAEIFACVRALRAADTSVLLVEQNARAALAIADRGYVLETGRIVMTGTGSELAADAGVRAAYLGF
jgi:branched-chain amino acid transport system ATP-binding protein